MFDCEQFSLIAPYFRQ